MKLSDLIVNLATVLYCCKCSFIMVLPSIPFRSRWTKKGQWVILS